MTRQRRLVWASGVALTIALLWFVVPAPGTDSRSLPTSSKRSLAAASEPEENPAADSERPPPPHRVPSDTQSGFAPLPEDRDALRDLLPELLRRAQQGDPAAACWAAAELRSCRWSAVSGVVNSRCEGIDPAGLRRAIPLALQAARAGDHQSAIDFIGLHPFSSQDFIADPSLIELYRREGVALLEHELHRGNAAVSLMLMMRGAHDPLPFESLLPDALRNPRIRQAIHQRILASWMDRLPASDTGLFAEQGRPIEEFRGLSTTERVQFDDYWQQNLAQSEALGWPGLAEAIRDRQPEPSDRLPPRDRCAKLQ